MSDICTQVSSRPSFTPVKIPVVSKGFTLVELLVVIGIIALLISILLPSLNAARQSAVKTQCLSNLRELGNTMAIYASQFNGRIPIGASSSEFQFSYVVNFNNGNAIFTPGPQNLGLLAVARLTKNPKAFYCPSETISTFMYDDANNLWPSFETYPVDPRGLFTIGATSKHTRMGYFTAPAARFRIEVGPGVAPELVGGTATAPLPYYAAEGLAAGAIGYPVLAKMKGNYGAIAADLLLGPVDVTRRHKTGANVLFGNGSAQFIDLKGVMRGYSPTNNKVTEMLVPASDGVEAKTTWQSWRNVPVNAGNTVDPGGYGAVSGSYNDIFFKPGARTVDRRGVVSVTPATGIWIQLSRGMR